MKELIEKMKGEVQDNIRIIRESKKMSRSDVDNQLGHQGASSKLERGGTKDIGLSRLTELSEIFKVDIRTFFNRPVQKKLETADEDQPAYSPEELVTKTDLEKFRESLLAEFKELLEQKFPADRNYSRKAKK